MSRGDRRWLAEVTGGLFLGALMCAVLILASMR